MDESRANQTVLLEEFTAYWVVWRFKNIQNMGPGEKTPFRNNIFTYLYRFRISPWSYWNLQQVFSPTDFLLAPRFKSIGWQSLRNIWRCKLLRILRIPNPSFFWRVKPWNPMILRVKTIQYTSMSCLFVLVDPPYRFPCDGKDLSSCTRTPTSISERSNVYWFGGYRWTLCIACCLHLFTYFFRWKYTSLNSIEWSHIRSCSKWDMDLVRYL